MDVICPATDERRPIEWVLLQGNVLHLGFQEKSSSFKNELLDVLRPPVGNIVIARNRHSLTALLWRRRYADQSSVHECLVSEKNQGLVLVSKTSAEV